MAGVARKKSHALHQRRGVIVRRFVVFTSSLSQHAVNKVVPDRFIETLGPFALNGFAVLGPSTSLGSFSVATWSVLAPCTRFRSRSPAGQASRRAASSSGVRTTRNQPIPANFVSFQILKSSPADTLLARNAWFYPSPVVYFASLHRSTPRHARVCTRTSSGLRGT